MAIYTVSEMKNFVLAWPFTLFSPGKEGEGEGGGRGEGGGEH